MSNEIICDACDVQICPDAEGSCMLIKKLRAENAIQAAMIEAMARDLAEKDAVLTAYKEDLEAADTKIVDCEARSMSENFAMVTMQTELEASQTAESQLASVSTEQVEIIRQLQDELEAANATLQGQGDAIAELRADLEAAKAENAILNRMVSNATTRLTGKCQPNADADTCLQYSTIEKAYPLFCPRCWREYLRAEAEKEKEQGE